jgi:hypothetical protein
MRKIALVFILLVFSTVSSFSHNNKYSAELSYLSPGGDMSAFTSSGLGVTFAYERTINEGLAWHLDIGYQYFSPASATYNAPKNYNGDFETIDHESQISILPIRAGLIVVFTDDQVINVYMGMSTGAYICHVDNIKNTHKIITVGTNTYLGVAPSIGVYIPLNKRKDVGLKIGVSYDLFFGIPSEVASENSFAYFRITASMDFGFTLKD